MLRLDVYIADYMKQWSMYLYCPRYQQERQTLKIALQRNHMTLGIREMLQRRSGDVGYRAIFRFLENTGINRII